jgi:hypothetical protein
MSDIQVGTLEEGALLLLSLSFRFHGLLGGAAVARSGIDA